MFKVTGGVLNVRCVCVSVCLVYVPVLCECEVNHSIGGRANTMSAERNGVKTEMCSHQ